jgi:hypothetical protein
MDERFEGCAAMRDLEHTRALRLTLPMPDRQIGTDLFDDLSGQHGRASGKVVGEHGQQGQVNRLSMTE